MFMFMYFASSNSTIKTKRLSRLTNIVIDKERNRIINIELMRKSWYWAALDSIPRQNLSLCLQGVKRWYQSSWHFCTRNETVHICLSPFSSRYTYDQSLILRHADNLGKNLQPGVANCMIMNFLMSVIKTQFKRGRGTVCNFLDSFRPICSTTVLSLCPQDFSNIASWSVHKQLR